jgi:prophage maintenance system killer protein
LSVYQKLPARDVRKAVGSFLTGFTFLYENGYVIVADQAEVVAAMLSLADHRLDEAGYAAWLREHVGRNH